MLTLLSYYQNRDLTDNQLTFLPGKILDLPNLQILYVSFLNIRAYVPNREVDKNDIGMLALTNEQLGKLRLLGTKGNLRVDEMPNCSAPASLRMIGDVSVCVLIVGM